MKKRTKTCIANVLAAFLCFYMLQACSGEESTSSPEADEITLSGGSLDYATDGINATSEGGSTTISFSTNRDWKVTVPPSQSSWCSIKPASGPAGNGSFTITANENESYEARTAIVTLTAGTTTKSITVTQQQKNAIQASPAIVTLGSHEQETTIEVKANIEYSIKISDNAKSWITYVESKAERALISQKLTFKIAENESSVIRGGEITFSTGIISTSIKIEQMGKEESGSSQNITGGNENYDEEQGKWNE